MTLPDCPTCRAPLGSPCVSTGRLLPKGTPCERPHIARARLAPIPSAPSGELRWVSAPYSAGKPSWQRERLLVNDRGTSVAYHFAAEGFRGRCGHRVGVCKLSGWSLPTLGSAKHGSAAAEQLERRLRADAEQAIRAHAAETRIPRNLASVGALAWTA